MGSPAIDYLSGGSPPCSPSLSPAKSLKQKIFVDECTEVTADEAVIRAQLAAVQLGYYEDEIITKYEQLLTSNTGSGPHERFIVYAKRSILRQRIVSWIGEHTGSASQVIHVNCRYNTLCRNLFSQIPKHLSNEIQWYEVDDEIITNSKRAIFEDDVPLYSILSFSDFESGVQSSDISTSIPTLIITENVVFDSLLHAAVRITRACTSSTILGIDTLVTNDSFGETIIAARQKRYGNCADHRKYFTLSDVGCVLDILEDRKRELYCQTLFDFGIRKILNDTIERKRLSHIDVIPFEDVIAATVRTCFYGSDSNEKSSSQSLSASVTAAHQTVSGHATQATLNYLRPLPGFDVSLDSTVVVQKSKTSVITINGETGHLKTYNVVPGGRQNRNPLIETFSGKGFRPSETTNFNANLVGPDHLIITGGHALGTCELQFPHIYIFHIPTTTWSVTGLCDEIRPGPRWKHSSTVFEERICFLYGGLSHSCQVLSDLWEYTLETNVWREIVQENPMYPCFPHRFGAALIILHIKTKTDDGDGGDDDDDDSEGSSEPCLIIHNGMDESFSISNKVHSYGLISKQIHNMNIDNQIARLSHSLSIFTDDSDKDVPSRDLILILGGLSDCVHPAGWNYLLNMNIKDNNLFIDTQPIPALVTEDSTVLVRHTVCLLQRNTILLSGGGGRFPFHGAFYNQARIAVCMATSNSPEKRFQEARKEATALPRIESPSEKHWEQCYEKRHPFVMENGDFGDCLSKWSPSYLKEKLEGRDASVSTCPSQRMTFHPRNFTFEVQQFTDIIDEIFTPTNKKKKRHLYYRSMGVNMRKDPANFWATMPEIKDDFKLPEFLDKHVSDDVVGGVFSSSLRLSSKGIVMWCHYDIQDNVLFQVKGCKHVLLFPPDEHKNLYIQGSTSLANDVTNADKTNFPLIQQAMKRCRYAVLKPGDMLFIPACWFHTTWTAEPSVGINVFFRHLAAPLYDKSDLYGNKDLLPAQVALKAASKLHKLIEQIPEEYRSFYVDIITNNMSSLYGSPKIGVIKEEDYEEHIPTPRMSFEDD